MPYGSNADLPPAVRDHLPPHAQDIFRSAFNHAWSAHADDDPAGREVTAFRIAWGAVKKSYRKTGMHWLPIAGEP